MKKNFIYAAALFMGLTISFSSCSDDDDEPNVPGGGEQVDPEDDGTKDPANIEYNSKNAKSWHNYMGVVAKLLKEDSEKLYNEWTTNKYGENFKNPGENNPTGFKTYSACVQQIIDGCIDIAGEVGDAKIGDPYDKFISGDKTGALYAVESWYSWHSREDYSNNIVSVQNAFYGQRNQTTGIDVDGYTYHENSIAKIVKAENEALFTEMDEAIKGAYKAILAIPAPFRNHIGSAESKAAIDACGVLAEALDKLKAYIVDNFASAERDALLDPVVKQYVDAVVLPTYKDLRDENNALYDVIAKLAKDPTNANFKAACDQWIVAREPWEESEAFLFGPVGDFGLDPNMDSWPLDQAAIVNILNSGKFDDLVWDGDYSEENEDIANKQSVRGYHTLEFLLFKDGEPRKVK